MVAAVTSGCAGATIKDKMNAYMGQPVNALIAKIGFPTDQQTIANQKVYLWTTVRFVEGSSYQCKIRVILGPQDIIQQWDYEGNEGGCGSYAMALAR